MDISRPGAVDPENLEDLFGYALRCTGEKKFAEAIGALIPVTRADGHHLQFRAWLDLGEAFKGLGDFAGAELAYLKAIPMDPGSYWPIRGLAEMTRVRFGVERAVALCESHYGPLRPDGRAAILRYICAIKAEEKFNADRATQDWRIHPAREIPALNDAVIMLMVKDEDDIIGQNLRHHYAMGFRRFCILDNGSTDNTANIISAFRQAFTDAMVVYIHDPIAGYYQAAKMAAAEQFCELYMPIHGLKPGWMFFIDADEFMVFAGTGNGDGKAERLNASLTAPALNLLVMHWIHCASPGLIAVVPTDADPFEVFTKSCSVLTPQVPKIAYRAGQGLQVAMGNHFVNDYGHGLNQAINGSDFGLYIAHFPMRSLTQVRKKVINGGQAYLRAEGLHEHGGHWRERYALYEKHGDAVIGQMLANHIRDTR